MSATTPTNAAKPVSGGLAARMAALQQASASSAPATATAPKPQPAAGGGVAAKFQANVAAASTPAAGGAAKPPPVVRAPSAGLANKMGALAINPGMMAGAAGAKKSMADIMFEKFDADGSGTIDDGEMHLLCCKMGYLITAGETALVVKTLDLDGSGKIDKNEFKVWWNSNDRWAAIQLDAKDLEVRQKASEAFAAHDTTGKGVLNKADFESFYKALVDKQLTTKTKEAVFADLDKNGDGTISFAEYSAWLEAIGTVKVKVLTQAMVDAGKQVKLRSAAAAAPAAAKK